MSSGTSEARFTINVKEGIVELEGKESFVDKHLDRFEEIFKAAVKEAIASGIRGKIALKTQAAPSALSEVQEVSATPEQKQAPAKHAPRVAPALPPIPVDLKSAKDKPGLREFYAEKKPANHYEKAAVFAYYVTKFNKQQEVKYGEILSCYEEVNEKKPSVTDIVKNSIRYKGWLEQGSDKFSTRLTISGENFVKFDLPGKEQDYARHQSNPT
ncbi:hypothetical protein [Nitrososphaera sp.]|uniref:hypothetical protein n=1 Tax=Nitrososphaera sp. TaxID=1971748 RepID=UPI002ED96981